MNSKNSSGLVLDNLFRLTRAFLSIKEGSSPKGQAFLIRLRKGLALALFVLRVSADHVNDPSSFYYLALLADLLYA